MPSVLELAEICNASYDSQPVVEGWETLTPIYNFPRSGFFGAVLRKGNDYVMVFRGTDDKTHDVVSDTTLALGYTPQQYYTAKKSLLMFLSNFATTSSNLMLTGHSLGGGLASLVSARGHNLPVVTFNSPGMFRAATNSGFTPLSGPYNYITNKNGIRSYVNEFKKVLHIRSEGDLVSVGTGRKIINNNISLANPICPNPKGWNMVSIAAQSFAQALCAHSMENMVTIIKNIPEFSEDISWV